MRKRTTLGTTLVLLLSCGETAVKDPGGGPPAAGSPMMMPPPTMPTPPMSGPATGGAPDGGSGPLTCNNPTFPQKCPARDNVPEACWSTRIDCNTVSTCGTARFACYRGFKPDCRYLANRCVPENDVCPDPAFSLLCPAVGVIGPGCFRPGYDCSTSVICGDIVVACPPGQKVDCYTSTGCVPNPAFIPRDGSAPIPPPRDGAASDTAVDRVD